MIKTQFFHSNTSHFSNIILKWETRGQKDFPVLNEGIRPPIPYLEIWSWAKYRHTSQPDFWEGWWMPGNSHSLSALLFVEAPSLQDQPGQDKLA